MSASAVPVAPVIPASPASATAAPPVDPIVSSKLMEAYLDVSVIQQTAELVTFETAPGQVELFTIGSDANVYNVRLSSSGDGSYEVIDTQLQATKIAGGLGPDGSRVIFGLQSNGAVMLTTSTDGQTWATPDWIDFTFNNDIIGLAYRAFRKSGSSGKDRFILLLQKVMTGGPQPGPFSTMNILEWTGGTSVNLLGQYQAELNANALLTLQGDEPALVALITQQLAVITTTSFDSTVIYDDHGGGGPMDIALWRPLYPPPFVSAGDYAQTNYDPPSGSMIGLASLDGPGQTPLLASPTSFQQIYLDQGSGAYLDGSLWWPVAPDGYTALGGVANGAANSSGWEPPSTDVVSVLRSDFAVAADFGELLWQNNQKSGMTAVSVWQIEAPANGQTLNTFWSEPDHNSTPSGNVFSPLQLPLSAAAFVTGFSEVSFTSPSISGSFSVVAAAAAPNGGDKSFALPPLAIVQYGGLISVFDQTTSSWAALPAPDDSTMFADVAVAASDDRKALMVFGLSEADELFVAEVPADGSFSAAPLWARIDEDVAQLSVASAEGGPQAFVVTHSQELHRLWRTGGGSGDWQVATLTVRSPEKAQEIRAYATEITVLDSGGVAKPLAQARLWASGAATAVVNGQSVQLDPESGAEVRADVTGKLVIEVIAQDLFTVSLKLHTELMADDARYEIQANAAIKDKLSTITSGDLAAARDKATNEPLLPDKSSDDLDHLACSLNHVAGLTVDAAPPPRPRPAFVRASPNQHVWFEPHDTGRYHDEIPEQRLREAPSFVIDRLPGDRLTCSTLTPAEGRAMREQLERESSRAVPDSFLSGKSWGQIWAAVRSGIVKLGKFLVTEGWLVMRTIAGAVYKFELKLYQQVFDVLQEIFTWVKVKVSQLLNWLSELFDWGDILRTHTVIRHTLDQAFPFLDGAVSQLEGLVDSQIKRFERNLDTWFDSLTAKLGTQQLGGSLAAAPPDKAVSSGGDHNILCNALITHGNKSTLAGPSSATAADPRAFEGWQSLLEAVRAKLATFDAGDGFKRAQQAFRQATSNPAELPTLGWTALLDVMKGIARFGLELARVSFELFLDAVRAVLELTREALNAELKIPIIGPLYRRLTGSPLSVLDLVAMVLGLGSTLAFKLLHSGTSPFPDEASVQQVRDAFTSTWLLGLLDGGWVRAPFDEGTQLASVQPLPQGLAAYRSFIPTAGAAALVIRTLLAAAVDSGIPKEFSSKAPSLRVGPPTSGLSAALVSMDLLLQFLQMPWWFTEKFSKKLPHFDRLAWIIPGWLGPAANVLSFGVTWVLGQSTNSPAETLKTFSDVTVVITMALGVFGFTWNMIGIVEFWDDLGGADVAFRLLEPINNFFEFLRLSQWAEALAFTIPGLVVLDLVLGVASSVLFFFNADRALKAQQAGAD